MGNNINENSISCRECQAGFFRQKFVTYLTWMSGELITVPDFPAWVCDVCGRREYDYGAISRLSLILNPNAGRSSPRKRLFPSGIDDQELTTGLGFNKE